LVLTSLKANFNNTDEIRNLEYEYDLMDNVTQRQNHISGLSEGFTYDALDRLTQQYYYHYQQLNLACGDECY
jgi:hypothetical protein